MSHNVVIADINYTAPLELYKVEKPFYSNVPAPDGRQSNQVARVYHGIHVSDIRGVVQSFNMDKHGFEVVRSGGEDGGGNFESDAWIEQAYYPVIEKVLQARLGDVRVRIFDHTVRRRTTVEASRGAKDNRATRQPSHSAHCDQTFLSGENRIRLHMGDEAPALLKKTCQIINVWRPLFGPLGDAPLAYCDWNTVDVGRDYLPADLIFPHYIGEQYLVTHHPSHRWYYLSGQRTNEFTFLKCWDSRDDVARCVAHTSFIDPRTPRNARLRESIEFRCLVFHTN